MKQHIFKSRSVQGECRHILSNGVMCLRYRNDDRHKKSASHILFVGLKKRGVGDGSALRTRTVDLRMGVGKQYAQDIRLREATDSEELATFEGGATRTAKPERRQLIPKSAIDALARRLDLGAKKHGVNNWRKGGVEFRMETVNHLLDHVFEYLEKGGRENADAIICNAAFLCEFEEKEPYAGVEPKKSRFKHCDYPTCKKALITDNVCSDHINTNIHRLYLGLEEEPTDTAVRQSKKRARTQS